MVRHNYRNGVDIPTPKKLPEVTICGTVLITVLFVNNITGPVAMNPVNITDRNNPYIISAQKTLQVNCTLTAGPLAPHSDAAHSNTITRRYITGLAQG
jgi:hypothetical protein